VPVSTNSILTVPDTDPPPPRSGRLRLAMGVTLVSVAVSVMIAIGGRWLIDWRGAPPLPSGNVEQITSSGATETSPTLSPDGQWVAYRSDELGTGDIFIRRIGDEHAINLTSGLGGDESDPAFSPDGEWIAFRSTRESGGIFVMKRDGTSLRHLTQFGVTPAWTPDGRTIIFATRGGIAAASSRASTSEGWKVDVASAVVSRITRSDFRYPSVSPNGRRIAYWGYAGSFGRRDPISRADIWTMRLDGSAAVRVTNDDTMDWSPIWSSDGRHLYFVSNRGGLQGIWRVEIDERSGRARGVPEPVSALPSAAGSLTRSAGDQRFAWSTFASSRSIYRMSFSADARAVTGEAALVIKGAVPFTSAEPSPDGTMVVLASGPPSEDIYVAHADGSGVKAITDALGRDTSPRWSPDGRLIAFESDRDAIDTVWLANADGSAMRRLARSAGELAHPVWSPDGSKVAVWDREVNRLRIYPVLDEPAVEPLETMRDFTSGEFAPGAWSPDGAWIAGTAAGSVWIYSLRRGTFERVAPGSAPAWLADSTRLLYVNEGRIQMAEIVWKFTREVMALPGEDLGAPSLTRDDRVLYFSRPRTDADLWVLTVR
jgi:eukaryotic-like serine/threonine-protein kinase